MRPWMPSREVALNVNEARDMTALYPLPAWNALVGTSGSRLPLAFAAGDDAAEFTSRIWATASRATSLNWHHASRTELM